jgi:hypothetical protein
MLPRLYLRVNVRVSVRVDLHEGVTCACAVERRQMTNGGQTKQSATVSSFKELS